jgi:hypothetical protein
MPPGMLKTLPGYDPDGQKNRAEARDIMEKLGYGPAKRLECWASHNSAVVPSHFTETTARPCGPQPRHLTASPGRAPWHRAQPELQQRRWRQQFDVIGRRRNQLSAIRRLHRRLRNPLAHNCAEDAILQGERG